MNPFSKAPVGSPRDASVRILSELRIIRSKRKTEAPLVPEEKDGRPLEVKIWRLDGLPVHRSHEAASGGLTSCGVARASGLGDGDR
ncbi:unnamed protein product [Durusdinium trenchii]|uniref:Uncharacterized protein n=1 Tax=Durusdinium trenchii TaxID=1381693 RepID=A0ABP0M000_9DINO